MEACFLNGFRPFLPHGYQGRGHGQGPGALQSQDQGGGGRVHRRRGGHPSADEGPLPGGPGAGRPSPYRHPRPGVQGDAAQEGFRGPAGQGGPRHPPGRGDRGRVHHPVGGGEHQGPVQRGCGQDRGPGQELGGAHGDIQPEGGGGQPALVRDPVPHQGLGPGRINVPERISGLRVRGLPAGYPGPCGRLAQGGRGAGGPVPRAQRQEGAAHRFRWNGPAHEGGGQKMGELLRHPELPGRRGVHQPHRGQRGGSHPFLLPRDKLRPRGGGHPPGVREGQGRRVLRDQGGGHPQADPDRGRGSVQGGGDWNRDQLQHPQVHPQHAI